MFANPYILPTLSVVAIAGLFLVTTVIYGEESRAARSVIRRFFLTIAFPVAVTVAIPMVIAAQLLTVDVRIWQALIAALVLATGWLTSAIFTEQGQVRRKAERVRDYHKAIYAEIGTSIDAFWDAGNSDDHIETMLSRMQEDAEFVPFIPREHHDHIFDAIRQEIDVLPRQTIDVIVAYYSQIKAIAALAEDMRSKRFQEISADRRVLMYQDYLEMRKQAFVYGQLALKLIKAYSENGASAAEALMKRVNTPAADQSVPSQGSA